MSQRRIKKRGACRNRIRIHLGNPNLKSESEAGKDKMKANLVIPVPRVIMKPRQRAATYRLRWYDSKGKQREKVFNIKDYASKADAYANAKRFQKMQVSRTGDKRGSIIYEGEREYFELRWIDEKQELRGKTFAVKGNTPEATEKARQDAKEYMEYLESRLLSLGTMSSESPESQ
jgi:hypothetical protein